METDQHTLRFLHNGKPVTIRFNEGCRFKPSTTVLNYLRSFPDLKGTKEGCAEGDCGACTVVVAFQSGDKLIYKAFNSCLLFLPWLNGKHLITVEALSNNGELHPVQQLLIDHYGSQCGFCTPGIVMSLFALFKSGNQPDTNYAKTALSGNLCRCTGYQPILDVALKAMSLDGKDHFSSKEKDVIHFLNAVQIQSQTFTNKDQLYYRPDNLPTALELCEQHADAYMVNGGSDLALQQSKKFIHFPVVIDLSAIAELNEFREEEQAYIIGSGLNFEEVLHKLEGRLPVIEELLGVFASKQIRNLATFGGNIGSASPIGDTLPVLFALKASLGLVSASGVRIIPVETFIKGYRKTDLKRGELILNIVIPKPDEHSIVRFYKVSKRKDVDISTVSLAARLKRNSDNEVAEIILAYGGMAEVVKRATLAEGYLLGKRLTEEIIHEACKLIDSGFEPISDARSGNEARKIMAKNLLVKLFAETCQTPECYA